jgi:DNA-binding winged helix-turn-helix (wHTH) protein
MFVMTYRKLLTRQGAMPRIIPNRRFAGLGPRQTEAERLMRILILGDAGEELDGIESAIREREVEIRRADAVERFYVFAGWTLEEMARNLVSPAGRRVDLTSSEFDLLIAFLRQPGHALSRSALLGALRGREWTYYDRSIDTLVARLRKKLAGSLDRPPLIRSVRGVGYVFCAAVSGYASRDSLPSEAASATGDAYGSGRLFLSAPR